MALVVIQFCFPVLKTHRMTHDVSKGPLEMTSPKTAAQAGSATGGDPSPAAF